MACSPPPASGDPPSRRSVSAFLLGSAAATGALGLILTRSPVLAALVAGLTVAVVVIAAMLLRP